MKPSHFSRVPRAFGIGSRLTRNRAHRLVTLMLLCAWRAITTDSTCYAGEDVWTWDRGGGQVWAGQTLQFLGGGISSPAGAQRPCGIEEIRNDHEAN
jgi:hypothetical protein